MAAMPSPVESCSWMALPPHAGKFRALVPRRVVGVPVQDVERSASVLPPGELWVHCRSGYRAGIAASLLHRRDRTVVHVDDDWERVAELGIAVTTRAA